MFAKLSALAALWGKIITAVFTTVAAPVLVHVVVKDLESGEPQRPAPRAESPRALLDGCIPLTVNGLGATPEEALQSGLRTALWSVLGSLVEADTWSRDWRVIFEAVLRHSEGLILRCEDLGVGKDYRPTGVVYRRQLAVEVARGLLASRLNALHVRLRDGTGMLPGGTRAK